MSYVAGGGALCCCLILCIVLFSISWDSLEIDEYGLQYNSITKTVDNTPYQEGRYFLGPGRSFIRFPKTLQSISFATGSHTPQLKGRTSDGLLVELEISFQYKLFKHVLFDLYSEYGDAYLQIFLKMARAQLISIASQYTAYDFFSERQTISGAMHESLEELFARELHAEVQFFQLRGVDLPDKFEQAIEEAQVAAQTIERVRHERETVRVQTQTRVLQARYQANITRTLAKSVADSLILQNNADIDVLTFTENARARSYNAFIDATSFNAEQLLEYIKIRALNNHNEEQMVIAVDSVQAPAS